MTIDIKLQRLGVFNYIVTWHGTKIRFYTRRGAVKFAREELIKFMESNKEMTTHEVLMIAARYVEIGNHYDD